MQFFLFGDTSKSSRGDAINLILLQIKQYIFNCKYFQKKLSLVTMQRKIQSLYNIEKSIAIKNKKIDFFNQIWTVTIIHHVHKQYNFDFEKFPVITSLYTFQKRKCIQNGLFQPDMECFHFTV
jgi:hypothetical protein